MSTSLLTQLSHARNAGDPHLYAAWAAAQQQAFRTLFYLSHCLRDCLLISLRLLFYLFVAWAAAQEQACRTPACLSTCVRSPTHLFATAFWGAGAAAQQYA
eukprot:1159097-Pelagomonas_calceolata.AAC.6